MANKKNTFAGKVKQGNKKKPSGKRIGKSKQTVFGRANLAPKN